MARPIETTEPEMDMYLRHVPVDLVRAIKVAAILKGQTQHEWLIQAAEERLAREAKG